MRDLNEQIELLKIKSASVKLETNRHVTGRNVQAERSQAQRADSHTHEGTGVPLRNWADLRRGWNWADLRRGWLSGRISSHCSHTQLAPKALSPPPARAETRELPEKWDPGLRAKSDQGADGLQGEPILHFPFLKWRSNLRSC